MVAQAKLDPPQWQDRSNLPGLERHNRGNQDQGADIVFFGKLLCGTLPILQALKDPLGSWTAGSIRQMKIFQSKEEGFSQLR
jgi:hypothetical protein